MILNMNLLVVLLLTWTGLGTTFFYRREIRFTKVTGHFFNNSIGEVVDLSIRQYYGHHYVNFDTNVKIPISMNLISVELLRCKDHYIDCVNYHSYMITNYCNGVNFYMLMVIKDQPIPKNFKCPIKGKVGIQNMTIDAEKVNAMLGNALEEPWWDSHWVLRASIMNNHKHPYFVTEFRYYFISNVVYTRNTKKN